MPFTFNTEEDVRAMLAAIGAASTEELFQSIPESIRLRRPLQIGAALGELELTQHLSALAGRNVHAGQKVCFLGGGCYDHFIPAAVDLLASRGEFYTSYTPYQPEVSQGTLQAIFEYQTMICQLTGMDVSNASLYDGGTATAEAVLMCQAATGRNRVVLVDTVHPEYRQVVECYLRHQLDSITTVQTAHGVIDPGVLEAAVDDQTACVVVAHPNFFGALERVRAAAAIARQRGAALVQIFDPTSLGILKSPAALGADVAVAEGQCLGNPMAFGGPYLGIIACRDAFLRRLPGRIAGQTTGENGRRCWVLTLQTREQHIRREKATSNICTNQGLFALRASIYLSLMGPSGLRALGELCARKARYAARQWTRGSRLVRAFDAPTFKEFVLRDTAGNPGELLRRGESSGFFAGIELGRWYPHLDDCLLIAVTEKRTRSEIDALAETWAAQPHNREVLHA